VQTLTPYWRLHFLHTWFWFSGTFKAEKHSPAYKFNLRIYWGRNASTAAAKWSEGAEGAARM